MTSENRRVGRVTFKGNPMTLVGDEIKIGQPAPDFEGADQALQPARLSDFKGRVVIVSAVPSIDTPVCEVQTVRFNQEAAKLNAQVLTVSLDLPMAQKRFCGAQGIDNIRLLSDYKDRQFGKKYGVFIEELCLLARAVFVIDKAGNVVYEEIVGEIAEHLDYEAVIAAARAAGA